MIELQRTEFERVRPLFRKMDIHLPLSAILSGQVNARIFVDDRALPHCAMTWTGYHVYLLGKPGNPDFKDGMRRAFFSLFKPEAVQAGIESYSIAYANEAWEPFIHEMLAGKYPIKFQRHYYAFKQAKTQVQLPEGVVLREVNAGLLKEPWDNLDFLTDEMPSERESVEDFLAKSFGVCLTKGKEITGWCLSEYNTGHRCEIGIATLYSYQKRGFAASMVAAFVALARKHNIARIGWHCSSTNNASIATALKAGFEKTAEYPVYVGWFDDPLNLCNNAYFAFGRNAYDEALDYFEKAFALVDVPDWAYWNAALAASMAGRTDQGLDYLEKAAEHGYDNPDHLATNQYLKNLHASPRWDALMDKLRKT